jgi:predicted transcriptional regulator
MKTASFPSLRVDPDLRQAAENVLHEGESLSSFLEQSIRDGIERRQAQREFVARGLIARDDARKKGAYLTSGAVIGRLEKILTRAKASPKTRR